MNKIANFFKKLGFGPAKKKRKCMQDNTGAYYCYEMIQGVYERTGDGPYASEPECKAGCGCEEQ
jgi:hypothetical protein